MSTRTLGTAGVAGASVWVLIVILLHFIQSDLGATDYYISDYALGDVGWLMKLAFIAVGVGTLAIAYGLLQSVESGKRAKTAIVLVALSGIGYVMAGAFNTDPTGAEETTAVGGLHLLGSVLVFIPLVIAPFFLRGVFSRTPQWKRMSRPTLVFALVLLALFIITFGTPEDGMVGLTQRLFVIPMMAWWITLGWHMRKLGESA